MHPIPGILSRFGTAARRNTGTGAGQVPLVAAGGGLDAGLVVPRGYIDGLTLSNNGSDPVNDIDITAGICRTADNTSAIETSSTLVKQLDASWAVGTNAGGLSSSLTFSLDTWYHAHAITVAGVNDIGFDTSITAANLVTDHSATAYRRIGAVLTDGAVQLLTFFQFFDWFFWVTPAHDIDRAVPVGAEANRNARVISTPLGVEVLADVIHVMETNTNGNSNIGILTAEEEADVAPGTNNSTSANAGSLYAFEGATLTQASRRMLVKTNTSSQIYDRATSSGGADDTHIFTRGWWDPRGRSA